MSIWSVSGVIKMEVCLSLSISTTAYKLLTHDTIVCVIFSLSLCVSLLITVVLESVSLLEILRVKHAAGVTSSITLGMATEVWLTDRAEWH